MQYLEKQRALGEAVELSHHLSELSKRRKTSPLKGMQKIVLKPGTIKMAGGARPVDGLAHGV